MRIAYIISAYQRPRQLVRMVKRLNTETSLFFIHVDKKTPDIVYAVMTDGLSLLTNVRFLERHTCVWGGFGHVAATLKGINEVVNSGTDVDFVVLLTGQDYPIKPNRHISDFLSGHRGSLFLDHFPLPHPEWQNLGLDRIDSWHLRLFNRHQRLAPPSWLGLRRRFPSGFQPFGGSSYWCLPHDAIEYVHRFCLEQPDFVRFFRTVDVPDELFFQTILLNSPFGERVVNDDLHFIDWRDPHAGSPAVLTTGDFARLQSSAKLFARKFDINQDAGILDMIDLHLLSESATRTPETEQPIGAAS